VVGEIDRGAQCRPLAASELLVLVAILIPGGACLCVKVACNWPSSVR